MSTQSGKIKLSKSKTSIADLDPQEKAKFVKIISELISLKRRHEELLEDHRDLENTIEENRGYYEGLEMNWQRTLSEKSAQLNSQISLNRDLNAKYAMSLGLLKLYQSKILDIVPELRASRNTVAEQSKRIQSLELSVAQLEDLVSNQKSTIESFERKGLESLDFDERAQILQMRVEDLTAQLLKHKAAAMQTEERYQQLEQGYSSLSKESEMIKFELIQKQDECVAMQHQLFLGLSDPRREKITALEESFEQSLPISRHVLDNVSDFSDFYFAGDHLSVTEQPKEADAELLLLAGEIAASNIAVGRENRLLEVGSASSRRDTDISIFRSDGEVGQSFPAKHGQTCGASAVEITRSKGITFDLGADQSFELETVRGSSSSSSSSSSKLLSKGLHGFTVTLASAGNNYTSNSSSTDLAVSGPERAAAAVKIKHKKPHPGKENNLNSAAANIKFIDDPLAEVAANWAAIPDGSAKNRGGRDSTEKKRVNFAGFMYEDSLAILESEAGARIARGDRCGGDNDDDNDDDDIGGGGLHKSSERSVKLLSEKNSKDRSIPRGKSVAKVRKSAAGAFPADAGTIAGAGTVAVAADSSARKVAEATGQQYQQRRRRVVNSVHISSRSIGVSMAAEGDGHGIAGRGNGSAADAGHFVDGQVRSAFKGVAPAPVTAPAPAPAPALLPSTTPHTSTRTRTSSSTSGGRSAAGISSREHNTSSGGGGGDTYYDESLFALLQELG